MTGKRTVTGTLVNTAAIVAGSLAGAVIGSRLPDRIKTIVMQALGLSVVLIGLQMALSGTRPLLVIGSLLAGAVTGELMNIERAVANLGERLKKRLRSDSSTFVQGFVTASILYCTGAMVIVGSIRDGTVGDPSILYIKALLDGVASVAFASSLGLGVAFSALSVFVVQGSITLLSSQLTFLQEPAVIEAVTATGGLLILGIGINILEIRKIRVGNLVPALLYAILAAMYI
ncbi:MAG TPA: DUF554 domain-containing protein [Syntrophales bacterium]|jgi:hypothetical protein|nr:DUF554 domain-containing protein [Syntrophales bacterium]HPV54720.1 DUF554 domain-containing protein [Syntrophales bacterium]HPX02864.1 DUF554 domain-containing protein [Syntrophales bacterium]HQC24462.1 DUF554 domain-containing protein [Syntrophales bacterium]